MKKILIILIILLLLGGLGVLGFRFLSGPINGLCQSNPSLFRFAAFNNLCANLKLSSTQKCNFENHTCENFIPQKDSGNFKITITINGQPGKGMEIDLWFKPSPGGDSFLKNTDSNGIALFEGIPPGTYYPSTNLSNFPKEYGNAYQNWTWTNVEIVKGKTTEMKMDLHSSP